MKRRILSIILAALLVFSGFGGVLAEAVTHVREDNPTGSCGNYLSWEYDLDSHVLHITGEGEMRKYDAMCAPWFSYNEQISSVDIGPDVTTISDHAFFRLSNITSFYVPSGIETIGYGAFAQCYSLMNFSVSAANSSYTTIGGVLYTADQKTLIAFPGGRTGEYTVPNGTEIIGSGSFYAAKITKVTIPEGVTNVMHSAFCTCFDLTEVNLPETLTSIGQEAFEHCTSLPRVSIPANVTELATLCFAHCDAMTIADVYGPAPTSYGYSMFSSCGSGFRIRYPYELRSSWDTKYNGYWTVSNYERYRLEPRYPASGTVGDNITWTWDQDNSVLTVTGTGAMPDFDNDSGAPWSCLHEMAQTLVIGEGITNIGDYAFTSFYSLTDLTIPSTVTSIGVQAFEGCSELQSVTVSAAVESIGYGAFQYCYNLASAVFEADPPAEFGENVFYGCGDGFYIGYYSAFASAWAPNGEIFWNGYFIRPVDAECPYGICGNSLAWIFDEDTGVLTITGTGWMYSFYSEDEEQPWEEYKNVITTVVIEEGVESIGSYAFIMYPAIETVYIPSTVTDIGENSFAACPSLLNIFVAAGNPNYFDIDGVLCGTSSGGGGGILSKNVRDEDEEEEDPVCLIRYPAGRTGAYTIPAQVTIIGDRAFIFCTALTGITFHNGITEIGNSAFAACSGLTSLTIPGNDIYIRDHAFTACTGLTTLVFGEGCLWTGEYSFTDCTSLTSITFPSTMECIGYYAFAGCTALDEVTIPASVYVMEYNAFVDCSNLSCAIFLGEKPEDYSSGIFDGCDDDFCIYYLEEYASSWAPEGETEWNDYPIAPYTGAPHVDISYGDVDCSGTVDFDDVTLLNAYLLNAAEVTEQGLRNANVNGDTKISSADVVALNKLILGSN